MIRRDIIVAIIIILVLAGLIFLRKKPQPPKEETRVPETLSLEKEIEERFRLEIPEDVEKAELKDVSGGTSSGIATRKYESGKFTHTILADLPDPEKGSFYEGWLVRGEEGSADYSLVSTGRIRLAKGGYLLEFESATDYSDHKKVIVTLERVADKNPEKHILEGNF